LLINDTLAQYVHRRDQKIVRNGNYQMEIAEFYYINNYYYKSGVMEEQRKVGKKYLKAKWKPDYKWKITNETKQLKDIR